MVDELLHATFSIIPELISYNRDSVCCWLPAVLLCVVPSPLLHLLTSDSLLPTQLPPRDRVMVLILNFCVLHHNIFASP